MTENNVEVEETFETNAEGVVRSALPYGQWTVAAGTYSTTADVRSDGSVGYPLELQAGGS